MKKFTVLLAAVVLLSGCAQKNYETRSAPCGAEAAPVAGVISIQLPDDLSAAAMSTQSGDSLYIADEYEVVLQTLQGGDVDATLKSCTGFDRGKLTVVQTQQDGLKRYDCAWTSAGEGAQAVSRATILDDGNYHYVLTVTAPGDWGEAVSAAWQQLSDSFRINIAQ